ncbi:MAG: hypothetical protein CMK99_13450 [Pseudomonas sp.]|jgi:hypothetical protein|nr:hypothetical protein [Pseudomonas sp.]HBS81047.1 hypothetical protein [Pseudomonas sp.]|tara:strand:+ start:10311 stop:10736 length:426 start_codon:yes stop_codon:yes gene_type:complete
MSTNRYIDKLKARLAKEADQRMQLQALLDDQVARNRALLAERDDLLRQVETLTDWYSNSLNVINEVTAALPGVQYMDPPDGGDVSVPEQVRRMAKDAERYRWLRHADLDALAEANWGPDGEVYRGDAFDQAIDAALQGEQP